MIAGQAAQLNADLVDLMVEVFGPKGRHARAAVSVPALPRGVAVEVDAIFEIV